ncbi:MAG: DUF2207 domain-containing protein [Parvibaculum sp.]
MSRFILAFLTASLLLVSAVHGRERITDYDIDLRVQSDGTLSVVETISVIAEHDRIKRGIFRDFPVRYRTAFGFNQYVPFDVKDVTRDGDVEPFFIEHTGNSARLYIGDADSYVRQGRHTYKITYQTNEQLNFSGNGTELYWNLIGTEWAFPIDKVRASVHLPTGAIVQDLNIYTGAAGETGKAADMRASGNRIAVANNHPLAPGEGITISAVWQNGLVDQSGAAARAWDFIADNLGFVIGLSALAGIATYFAQMWKRYGKDPETGTIIPLFNPPKNLSPVALGYIHARGFHGAVSPSSALTIAVTSLAIKGYLEITEAKKGYTLQLLGKEPADLPPGEAALLEQLNKLAIGGTVTLDGTYDASFSTLKSAFSTVIKREYTSAYFATNGGKWAIGLLLTVAALLATSTFNLSGAEDRIIGSVLTVFFSIAFAGFVTAARNVWLHWTDQKPGATRMGLTWAITICLGASIPALLLAIGLLVTAGLPVLLIAAPLVSLTTIFFWLMEAPTVYGRQIMDQIEGYMLFLSTTEWDRMQAREPIPTPNTALFEKHLAYSMALGVDEAWSTTFTKYAMLAALPPTTYHPAWYHSRSGGTPDFTGFSSNFSSSMSSTFASAASPPSSSSGSSGGGSSGGGGGGGGGGGW